MDIELIMQSLTREEKAALVAGTDFMYTNPVPRVHIPSVRMSDGPHGLRVQGAGGDNGVTGSEPATCFPTAATSASSWNPENTYRMGKAIGKEAKHYGVDVVLGPAVNIKRNPLGGRCFEYFSEDPYLAGKMGAAEVRGIQGEGVGSVQGNPLKLKENDLYVFNFIDSKNGRYSSVDGQNIISNWGMKWVPIINTNYMMPTDMEEFKIYATSNSVVNNKFLWEGVVLRDPTCDLSFRNVSREYLLKRHE